MRALWAQATVRALFGEGCGDPSLTTVYYDLGRIGLPHPTRLIRQKTICRRVKIQGRRKGPVEKVAEITVNLR